MTLYRLITLSSFFPLLLLVLPAPCSASAILSNSVDPPYQNTGTIFADQTTVKAVGVEIPVGPDYRFDSFRVVLHGIVDVALATARIYSDDGTGAPLAELQALNTSLVRVEPDVYNFVAPVPFTLQANERYWFAVSNGSSEAGIFRWDRTDLADEPNGIAGYLGYSFSEDTGATWTASSFFNAFELHATAVPEPAALLLVTSAVFFVCLIRIRSCNC